MTVPVTGPNFTAASFQNDAAQALLGYTSIASVNSGGGGAPRGVSISDIDATYRYIMFDIDTANGLGTGVGTFFGEIDIYGAPELTSIPETSSIALIGLGGLGFLIRRRRA